MRKILSWHKSAVYCCTATSDPIPTCSAYSDLFPLVSQDRIYWTDRDRAAVFMANRLTGQDIHALAENLNDPHDIVVFHQLRQPQGVWAVRVCVVAPLSFLCCDVCVCVSLDAPLWPSVWWWWRLWQWRERSKLWELKHIHISASKSVSTNGTIPVWIELNRAFNHECDGCSFPFLCVT